MLNWFTSILGGGLTNPKTTVTAIVGALVMIANSFGIVHITPEQQSAIIIVVLLVIGWLAADATSVEIEKK